MMASFAVWMVGELLEATLFVAEGEEHKIIDLHKLWGDGGVWNLHYCQVLMVTKNRVYRVKNVKRYIDLLDFALVSIFTLTLPSFSC